MAGSGLIFVHFLPIVGPVVNWPTSVKKGPIFRPFFKKGAMQAGLKIGPFFSAVGTSVCSNVFLFFKKASKRAKYPKPTGFWPKKGPISGVGNRQKVTFLQNFVTRFRKNGAI